MDIMRVGILGISYSSKTGKKLIREEIDRLLSDPNTEEIIFGTNSDTELYAIKHALNKRKNKQPRLISIIFNDMLSIPLNIELLLKKLDYVEELRMKERYSYDKLVSLCRIKIVEFSDKMIVFWDGNFGGSSYDIIKYIRNFNSKELSIINVTKR